MTPLRRLLVLVALLALASCAQDGPSRQGGGERAAPTADGPARNPGRRAMLEVRATFWLEVESGARAAELSRRLGAFATAQGGWVQTASIGEAGGSSQVTLRVPPSSLDALRALLTRTAAGGALRERVTSTDVTDALADLDARLRAARATESRLLALLEQRTGSLADVLAVERALGEVRARVEQLEAEQRGAQGRVDLATADVWLEHGALVGRAPLGRQVAVATRAGLRTAGDVLVGALLVALRAGPTLALLGVLVGVAVLIARRRRR